MSVRDCLCWDTDEPRIYTELPTSTRSAAIDINDSYWFPRRAKMVGENATMLELATSLTDFAFTDGQQPPSNQVTPQSARGQLDDFVAKLDGVTRLTVTPVVVSDVGSLAKLKKVVAVKLVLGCLLPDPPVAPQEIIHLVTNSGSLKRIELSAGIADSWSDNDKKDVRDAAEPNVRLTWI